jgi:hypothetical protein
MAPTCARHCSPNCIFSIREAKEISQLIEDRLWMTPNKVQVDSPTFSASQLNSNLISMRSIKEKLEDSSEVQPSNQSNASTNVREEMMDDEKENQDSEASSKSDWKSQTKPNKRLRLDLLTPTLLSSTSAVNDNVNTKNDKNEEGIHSPYMKLADTLGSTSTMLQNAIQTTNSTLQFVITMLCSHFEQSRDEMRLYREELKRAEDRRMEEIRQHDERMLYMLQSIIRVHRPDDPAASRGVIEEK